MHAVLGKILFYLGVSESVSEKLLFEKTFKEHMEESYMVIQKYVPHKRRKAADHKAVSYYMLNKFSKGDGRKNKKTKIQDRMRNVNSIKIGNCKIRSRNVELYSQKPLRFLRLLNNQGKDKCWHSAHRLMKYRTTKCSAEEMGDDRENTENNPTCHYVVSRWKRVFRKLCIINWNQNKKVT